MFINLKVLEISFMMKINKFELYKFQKKPIECN